MKTARTKGSHHIVGMTDYLCHPLDSCFERLKRADEHLLDFNSRVETMLMKQAYAVGIKLDQNPPHHIIEVTLPPETFFDMRFGVLVGEIFYNLRCSLDYLIFELAKLDSGVEQDGTQFPIVDTKKDFEGRAARWLKGMNNGHIAAIERLQPYNGCSWTKRLRECSNADKHRHLVQAGGTATINVHSSLEKDLARCWGYDRQIPHPAAGQPPVKMKVYPSGGVTFPDGATVPETVEEIKAQVAHTLIAFKPDF
jgi:hypothetical protein